MSKYVITIGRELGSGGKDIANRLGEQLGVPVYDRRLILLAAQESGIAPEMFRRCDEVPARGLMSSIMRNLASPFTSFSNIYANTLSRESLFRVQADIIRHKAETEDCIIVGRCADYVLRDHQRCLNVFVRADLSDRINFLTQREHITRSEARQRIARTDTTRAAFHDFYAETNWGDSRSYDLCVNASRLGLDGTAALILDFARHTLHVG